MTNSIQSFVHNNSHSTISSKKTFLQSFLGTTYIYIYSNIIFIMFKYLTTHYVLWNRLATTLAQTMKIVKYVQN